MVLGPASSLTPLWALRCAPAKRENSELTCARFSRQQEERPALSSFPPSKIVAFLPEDYPLALPLASGIAQPAIRNVEIETCRFIVGPVSACFSVRCEIVPSVHFLTESPSRLNQPLHSLIRPPHFLFFLPAFLRTATRNSTLSDSANPRTHSSRLVEHYRSVPLDCARTPCRFPHRRLGPSRGSYSVLLNVLLSLAGS